MRSSGCACPERADHGWPYPGIVKTKLDGVNQIDYLTGKSEKSARDYFFYYSGSTPSASIKEQHLDYRAKNVPLPVQP